MMNNRLKAILVTSVVILSVLAVALIITNNNGNSILPGNNNEADTKEDETIVYDSFLLSDEITVDLLPINKYTRPGTELKRVNAIVIHYVGNPGTTAKQNWNYFRTLSDTGERSASSHYIIGLEGEIIQCVPLNEISYASNDRNKDTIAIENCHPDATGKFNNNTYESLVKLAAALCRTYGLDPMTDVIRHYDVTGKLCPIYYVENEEEWYQLKLAIKHAM